MRTRQIAATAYARHVYPEKSMLMLTRGRISRALQQVLSRSRCCDGSAKAALFYSQAHTTSPRWVERSKRLFTSQAIRQQEVAARSTEAIPTPLERQSRQASVLPLTKQLPTVCPGCGAHSQTVEAESAGYYDLARSRVSGRKRAVKDEDAVFRAALDRDASLETGEETGKTRAENGSTTPICDRCHELLYHSKGTPVIHPSMQSIQAIIEESPHKHNHIYHVLDAADFPMSLIPNLQHALNLPRLRTKNRRSKTIRYLRGRVAEVSFIITRSDLLAPKKEQVDTLMPYLQEVLRDALGRTARKMRLGNVRCVSAKRGWWTKNVKEDVWSRGGAGWMVGKANVGKSALFEVVFPKGRNQQDDYNPDRLRDKAQAASERSAVSADSAGDLAEGGAETAVQPFEPFQETELEIDHEALEDPDEEGFDESEDDDDDISLLPPAQPETAYPVMPLVSSLPGTTASPIRIPFGAGKGELIDLPGVHRSSLDAHIKPEHHKDMVMKSRITPEQFSIRAGQSLLLGGLIRISPKMPDGVTMLAYPFLPPAFDPHVTGTHKAIAIQTGVHSSESLGREGEVYGGNIPSIATEDAKTQISSAGPFQLKWNVTKRRAGPLTSSSAGKQKADDLPFIVYSADLLLESVGWIELVCQVRRRSSSQSLDALSVLESEVQGPPEVEVYTPEGKFVGVRRPMGAWLLGGRKEVPAWKKRVRPRASIGLQKRREGGRGSKRSVVGVS